MLPIYIENCVVDIIDGLACPSRDTSQTRSQQAAAAQDTSSSVLASIRFVVVMNSTDLESKASVNIFAAGSLRYFRVLQSWGPKSSLNHALACSA